MIRLVQGEGEKRRLLALCEKTPFGCKIASIANSYGFDKSFANFWLNTEEDVVYCLVDGAMLLSGTVLQGDASREFLHVVGAREVLCAVRNAEAMNLTPTQVGDVLKHTQEPGDLPKELPPSVNIREIYTLLEKAGMIGEFLVRRAESYFPGKMLYVFREQHKNKEFYKSLGFTKTDTWVHSLL